MRKFIVKVNGNQYEVEVEEIKDNGTVREEESKPAPAAAPPLTADKESKTPAAAQGTVKVTAPMPGTIVKVSVSVGDTVEKGKGLVVLEAMKMENEITAPASGKVTAVNVNKGDKVNAGDLLVSIG